MVSTNPDTLFGGSIPELYDKYLVTLIFEPYAADLAYRLASRPVVRVLEFTGSPQIVTVSARSLAASPRLVADAYCLGTPLRNEIEMRDAARLGEATDAITEALAQRYGREAIDGKIQAHIVTMLG